MRYRYHLCHLVFVHPTGVSSSRYPSPGASVTHALSRHGSLLKLRQCKCRVLEAIYNCIFSLLCQSLCCLENARPPALRYLCTDAVYPYCILNSSTHCRVCPALSRLNHNPKLTLTLFMLRILTDYSDASFSFNNLAFFTNWFY